MRSIELTQGKEALVDGGVYDALSAHGWKWHCNSNGYAVTNIHYCDGSKQTCTTVLLHRWILKSYANIRLGGLQVDHINGNKLDNRLENLRPASHLQNQQNRGAQSDNKTGYKGVSFHKAMGKYLASIRVNGKSIHLGYYTNPLDAALAYDAAARQYHGSFANTNSKPLTEFKEYLRALVEE